MYNFTKQNPIISAVTATIATAVIAAMMYLLFEPTSMFAATTSNVFSVEQEIGAEISFSTSSGDISMNGAAIGGETGGTRTGSTTVAITTNDSSGYTLAIRFFDATGMEHASLADEITYYATTTPDFNMGLGGAVSAFAYSVSSTNAVSSFLNNGSACGAGAISSADNCYVMHTTPTSDFTIVDSSTSATAEPTVIGFQVIVGASSGLANGFYYATTTLTATTKS